MRITDENGKRVVTPDGISDKWLFFDETLLEDNERVELYPKLEIPDEETAKMEDEIISFNIDIVGGVNIKAMSQEKRAELLHFYRQCYHNFTYKDFLAEVNKAGVFKDMTDLRVEFENFFVNLILTVMDCIQKPETAKCKIASYLELQNEDFISGIRFTRPIMGVGLVKWLEAIDVADGRVGYYEYKSLLDWAERFETVAVLDLCQYKTFDVAGETDGNTAQLLEVLRRVCAYLYGTKVGRDVQWRIRRVILGESLAETTDTQTDTPDTQTDTPEGKALPDELNTKKGRDLLKKTVEAGYCNDKYYWNSKIWASGRDRVALACFVALASDYLKLTNKQNKDGTPQTRWKPFEDLFEFKGKRKNKAGIYDQIQQARKDCTKYNETLQDQPEYKMLSKFFDGLHTSTPQR